MDSQKPKIALYAQRSFGDKITAAFNFFSENWKVLIKYIIYLTLPICIVQALFINSFMGSYLNIVSSNVELFDSVDTPFWINYGIIISFSIVGTLIITSLVYALVKIYNDREERLEDLTFAILKPVLFHFIGRLFLIGLFMIAITIFLIAVIGILGVISRFTLLLTIPLLFACIIPLAIFPPIYLFEDINIGNAFIKSLRVGFATWGGIFSVSFVMGLIANVLYGVTTIPYYCMFIVKLFLTSDSQNEIVSSMGYSVVSYLFGILMFFGIYISGIFPLLGLAYQYGHSCEKMEHTSIASDIDKFEQL